MRESIAKRLKKLKELTEKQTANQGVIIGEKQLGVAA